MWKVCECGNAGCCGDGVVSRLGLVDMVVWVYVFVLTFFTAEDFVGAICKDFVDVHVVTCAGSSLIDIKNCLVVKFTAEEFFCGLFDGFLLFF